MQARDFAKKPRFDFTCYRSCRSARCRHSVRRGFGGNFVSRKATHAYVNHSTVRRSRVPSPASWTILASASLLMLCTAAGPTLAQMLPAAAGKAVLYEQDANNPQDGSSTVGTVVWRAERVAGPGGKADIVVHADINIPKKLTLKWSIERNNDKEMPASHIIKVEFSIPPGAGHGDVIQVPAMMVKATETTAGGARLQGLAAKVKDNYFLIGLTNFEADRKRNIEVLQQRPWVDVPVFFSDARRGLISFDEGAEGKRILAEAFAAWGK
jgi:hypothetical protein